MHNSVKKLHDSHFLNFMKSKNVNYVSYFKNYITLFSVEVFNFAAWCDNNLMKDKNGKN